MSKERYTKPEIEIIYLGVQLSILADLSSMEGEGSIDEWEFIDPEHNISAE